MFWSLMGIRNVSLLKTRSLAVKCGLSGSTCSFPNQNSHWERRLIPKARLSLYIG
uniref:Uncharacterized protein n=1 Tax=Kalanchoe fedtschenkoi TaxID=63787 RepID=A0A7N0U9W6_KALFE